MKQLPSLDKALQPPSDPFAASDSLALPDPVVLAGILRSPVSGEISKHVWDQALSLMATMIAFERNEYTNFKKMTAAVGEAGSGSLKRVSASLAELLKRCEAGIDPTAILPLCREAVDAFPMGIPVDARGRPQSHADGTAYDSLVVDLIRRGERLPHSAYHPEVEDWVHGTASEVAERVQRWVDPEKLPIEDLGKVFLSASLVASYAIAELPRELVAAGNGSYLGVVIDSVRGSFLLEVMNSMGLSRDRCLELEAWALDHMDALRERPLKTYAIPVQLKGTLEAALLMDINNSLKLMLEATYSRLSFHQANDVASALTMQPLAEFPASQRTPKERLVPVGALQVIIEQAPGRNLYYFLDGAQRTESLGVQTGSSNRGIGFRSMVSELGDHYVVPLSVGRIDEAGRLVGRDRCLFARPPQTVEAIKTQEVLNQAAATANQRVYDLWNQYPDLFSSLRDLGTITVVVRNEETTILCDAREREVVAPLVGLGELGSEAVAALLSELSIRPHAPWCGFRAVAPVAAVEPVPGPQRDLRDAIRENLNRFGPLKGADLALLLETDLGFERRNGKGDHKVFAGASGSHGIDGKNLSRNRTIRERVLWDAVEALAIPLADVLAALEKRRGAAR